MTLELKTCVFWKCSDCHLVRWLSASTCYAIDASTDWTASVQVFQNQGHKAGAGILLLLCGNWLT
jgi:hypothetical protein